MLVISRFRVTEAEADAFRGDLEQVHALLRDRPGYVAGRIGRNVDDPELWVISIEWENVGAYRRALSSYEVKVGAIPVLSRAIDEPSAYELVEPGAGLNIQVTRSLR
jgi:heme-degrading monooxygenase HmoA